MKKSIIICSVCIIALHTEAQKRTTKPPPPPPIAALAPVAPIPPPPPPPPPPVQEQDVPVPALPPLPPVPPVPAKEGELISREIINENGSEISIIRRNNEDMVYVSRNGDTQKIKLSTWNANRKAFEKKYGKLPPPPPPPPLP